MRLDEDQAKIRVTTLNRQVVDVETTLTSLRERERETGNRVASLHKQEKELEGTVGSLQAETTRLEGTVGSLRAETARLEGTAHRYCGCVHVLIHTCMIPCNIATVFDGQLHKETLYPRSFYLLYG